MYFHILNKNTAQNIMILYWCFSPTPKVSLTVFLSPVVFGISQVFAGEEADITSSMLSTEDADTPAEELVYNVEMPINGRVALKEAPDDEILNFTQAHVNKGEVVFVHEGELIRIRG